MCGQSTCVVCPLDSFCPAGIIESDTSTRYGVVTGELAYNCWPALFSGVTSPLLCPAGYRCPPSSSVPIACASNEACPVANASCCPPASACPATCPVCPAGSYATQSKGCLPCRAGFYCLGLQPPMPCPASFYCPGNTSLPVLCPAANMCPDTAMGASISCPDFQTSFMGSVKCDFSPGTHILSFLVVLFYVVGHLVESCFSFVL